MPNHSRYRVADQATALVSVLEILLKAELIPVAVLFMAVIVPSAIKAATSAYSIKSWPRMFFQHCLRRSCIV